MSATYEPGIVAVATVRGVPNVRVMLFRGGTGSLTWLSSEYVKGGRAHVGNEVADVRPLVVLDLADYDVADAVRALDDAANGLLPTPGNYDERRSVIFDIAQQIREQTRPPKPAEPTTWLAAVEDAEGNRWALTGGPTEPGLEWYSPDLNVRRPYAAVNAVRVLSEGVQG